MIDTHVHIANFQTPQPDMLLKSMDAHGVDRLVLFSEEPAYWETDPEKRKRHNAERLDRLFAWCQGSGGRLLPVSFINPTEPDAIAQVDEALSRDIIGFKIICETFYPGDERALPTYRHIANLGKSILFHSGILWDPCDCSKYNRPALFEALIYMAAIAGIDMQLYEAARIDGCGRFRQALYVTLPGIAPTIVILLILTMGSLFAVATDKILLLYTPLTYETGDVIGTYVYRKGIRGGDYSFSTAVGLAQTVVNFTLLIVVNNVSKRISEVSLW